MRALRSLQKLTSFYAYVLCSMWFTAPHTHTHTVQQRLSLHVSVGFCRTEAPLGILTAITTSHWQPIQITTTTTSSPTTTTYIYNDKIMKIKAKNAEFSKNFWTRYEIFSISRVTNTKRFFFMSNEGNGNRKKSTCHGFRSNESFYETLNSKRNSKSDECMNSFYLWDLVSIANKRYDS